MTALTDPIFGHAPTRAHFSDEAWVGAMARAEIALAEAQSSLGLVPKAAARKIAGLQAPCDVSDVLANGVAASGVPVPALVDLLRRDLSPQAADWLHYGATSQDIVDTALILCARAALEDHAANLTKLIDALHTLSERHAGTLMLARTRGQLATPVTFGLRVAQWAQPLIRLETQLDDLRAEALRVQLGGGAGSLSALGDTGPDIASKMAEELGLSDGPPWHTDRSAIRQLGSWLGRLIAATGKIGRDVSIQTRGEVAELRLTDAGSSSTMPHKANPVIAEALQSLIPLAIGCEAGLAAAPVHSEERDGANWPVEWALMPQLFELAGAALSHADGLVRSLIVDADAMRARAEADPSVLAEAAVFALAPQVGRVEASRIVSQALASDTPLHAALQAHGVVDWAQALSYDGFTRPASRVADQIFALRKTHRPGG